MAEQISVSEALKTGQVREVPRTLMEAALAMAKISTPTGLNLCALYAPAGFPSRLRQNVALWSVNCSDICRPPVCGLRTWVRCMAELSV